MTYTVALTEPKHQRILSLANNVPPDTLPVIEIFKAIEGEGTQIGKPKILLRLGGCAIGCVGCDTPYSWRVNPKHFMLIDTIVADVVAQTKDYTTHVAITGGEPLHYPEQLTHLVTQLKTRNLTISLETSGLFASHRLYSQLDFISFDIKTPSSGITLTNDNIEWLNKAHLLYNCQIKAIISDEQDLQFLADNFMGLLTNKKQDMILTPAAGKGFTPESVRGIILMIMRWNRDYSIRAIAQQHVLLCME